MKKLTLGFNSWGNFGVHSRTTYACGVGRVRSAVASTSRIYNYCNRTSSNPLACTFNLKPDSNSNVIPTI
jgi:hypothetical protein